MTLTFDEKKKCIRVRRLLDLFCHICVLMVGMFGLYYYRLY